VNAAHNQSDSSSRPSSQIVSHQASWGELLTIRLFLFVPFMALVILVPAVWTWGISWIDLALAAAMYVVSMLGVTVGYHRYFTHHSFKAKRFLRISMAISGGLAVQGSVIPWAADHRRHHAFSDREGDPHSPWEFGTSPFAVLKGMWHAHMGWMMCRDRTSVERFAPDLAADKDLQKIDKLFPLWVTFSFLVPSLVDGLITWSWRGLLTGFIWGGLARIILQNHVTWSINSICHMIGDRPFKSRDRSANFWPLAILSMGEAWHNLHHADPTSARHGVLRGQVDISARTIWIFEKLGWAHDVRWPTLQRLKRLGAK
jgi:stearoyl-CoA desaturase (delta-9 desaturase)